MAVQKNAIRLVAGLVLFGLESPVWAQAQAERVITSRDTQEADLGLVTISATRSQRAQNNVPGTVTVKTQAQLQVQGAQDLKSLLDDEPGVAVPKSQTRFTNEGSSTGRAGIEGVNIRGLEGNRVLMTQDGVRLPAAFAFGPIATGRGDYTETEALRAAEVLRGPVASQYGSDGLAGALVQRTLQAEDLLRGGREYGGFGRLAYSSADRTVLSTVAAAAKRDYWRGLLLGTWRRGHETASHGDVDLPNEKRTKPNPADLSQRYVLAKFAVTPSEAHLLGVTIETLRRRLWTHVLSARSSAAVVPAGGVLDLNTQDTIARDRFSLEYHYDDAASLGMQNAQVRVYWQDAQVRQVSYEERHIRPNRLRDSRYRTTLQGLAVDVQSQVGKGGASQKLRYGLDVSRSRVQGLRDGTMPPAGESFPNKPFADTTFTQSAAYVQSEMQWGPVEVIPGLRFDHYALKPSANGYQRALTALSGQALSPRLGVVWSAAESFIPYVQWSQGFKAPLPDEVNVHFENLAHGYTSVANPHLKPERAQSLELGVRGKVADVRYSLAGFDNRYQDFISREIVTGGGTPKNPWVFQYINLAQARIRGAEASVAWQVNPRWMLRASLASARGTTTSLGVTKPLDSVSPFKASASLRYDAQQFGAAVQAVHYAAKRANKANKVVDERRREVAAFLPRAHTVLDLSAYYKPHIDWTLTLHVNNVLNKRYWRWSDVRGVAANSPVLDAYSAPGRSVRMSLTYVF